MDEQGRGLPSDITGGKKFDRAKAKHAREILLLADQAAESGVKVLPGRKWGLHYPGGGADRGQVLQALLKGEMSAEDAAITLKPDALIYDITEVESAGLEATAARVRDLSARVKHYDYGRFAKFVSSLAGKDIQPETAVALYDHVISSRIQKKSIDAYGSTGREQMRRSLVGEAKDLLASLPSLSRLEKIMAGLKINWLAEKMGLISETELQQAVAQLSGDERKIFDQLAKQYTEYTSSGSEDAYASMTSRIRDSIETIEKDPSRHNEDEGGEEDGDDNGRPSESMQELEKQIKDIRDQVPNPGMPGDTSIPPDDQDEYHTPPPAGAGQESKEGAPSRPIFEIEPPLQGWYCEGRKSYFDVDTKTWSKKKQIQPYTKSVSFSKTHKISGYIDGGLKAIPLPNGYALDAASLKISGQAEMFRDQNGCFYIKSSGPTQFSVDFGKEASEAIGVPVSEDTQRLYRGKLSAKTESIISKMIGNPRQKAELARQYVLANHFYPGGGDLNAAQAVQYKLRSESTGDNYIQNLDSSEYLECYSANTLFISLMRASGVPARLIVGHKVDGAKKSKSQITDSTGHAWSEIWDGSRWVRFDSTPNPKPEDKKKKDEKDKEKEKEKKEAAEDADDGGADSPQQSQGQDGEPGEGQDSDQSSDSQSGEPKDGEQEGKKGQKSDKESQDQQDGQPGEASDQDVEEGEKQAEAAKEAQKEAEKKKQELSEKINKAESFKDLEDLKKELEQEEMFDEMKEELDEKLEAKEEQMKDEMKDELQKMADDGFLDEDKLKKLEEQMDKMTAEQMDQLQRQLEHENSLYNQYENIKEEIMPLVDKWFEYFVERLPKESDIDIDDTGHTRSGIYDRRSIMRPRNLLFGTVKNPRTFLPSFRPKFLASIMLDVSGSMGGSKLENSRKLLIFYCELFTRISKEYGYINFSINTFSDGITEIKRFGDDYDSPQRQIFSDGTQETVKYRLMSRVKTQGGTNMLPAVKRAAQDLNEAATDHPDFVSAMYFAGDGGDTCGNSGNITQFLKTNEEYGGFGQHMYSAVMLGDESQRRELANIFGDDHTRVAPDLDSLVEESMMSLEDDVEFYFRGKTTAASS